MWIVTIVMQQSSHYTSFYTSKRTCEYFKTFIRVILRATRLQTVHSHYARSNNNNRCQYSRSALSPRISQRLANNLNKKYVTNHESGNDDDRQRQFIATYYIRTKSGPVYLCRDRSVRKSANPPVNDVIQSILNCPRRARVVSKQAQRSEQRRNDEHLHGTMLTDTKSEEN